MALIQAITALFVLPPLTAAMRLFDGRLAFANLLETVVPLSGKGTLFSEKIRVLREVLSTAVTLEELSDDGSNTGHNSTVRSTTTNCCDEAL
mmetsp:Transcript_12259/g.12116  ORF Transcript_12259/g.12116 Transcript_12259/m.12116 type:complete len:92 (+) Transcript_12259:138-413(+)